MLQHALEAIHEAERQAAALVTDAGRRAAEMQEACTRDLRTMEERASAQASERRKALLAEADAKGAEDVQRLAADTAARIAALQAAAHPRMETAVQAVMTGLVRGGSSR